MKILLCSALVSLVSPALFVQAIPTPQGSGDRTVARHTATNLYGKRPAESDVLIFRFADLLEQLEGAFYTQALAKFQDSDFVDAGFSGNPAQQFEIIRGHEAAHSSFLQSTVESGGERPISCKFNFEPLLEDVASALALARTAEQIGTSTFSGTAHLLMDPSLLTRTATILSDEARHSSVLNLISGGTAFPAAFDVPLNANEALALVGPFIEGPCDTNITPNPSLAIKNKEPVTTGSLVKFRFTTSNRSSKNLFCQIISGDSIMATSMPLEECTIPTEGVMGPAYIWITSDREPLPNDVVARSMIETVVAGPVLTFIDK